MHSWKLSTEVVEVPQARAAGSVEHPSDSVDIHEHLRPCDPGEEKAEEMNIDDIRPEPGEEQMIRNISRISSSI